MIVIVGVLAISFSGCTVNHAGQEQFLSDVSINEEVEICEVIITEVEVVPILDPNPDKEEVQNVEKIKEPLIKVIVPSEPIIPQNLINDTNAPITTEPFVNTTPIIASSTPTITQSQQPTQATTPNPTPQPTPTPTPTPQPTPEPTPQPTPKPQPPPVIVEPPPARTICNICEADITENVAAHGTAYLLKGENFSYRVE